MMKFLRFGLLVMTMTLNATAGTLTDNGKSNYVIVEQPDAIPAEKTAGQELQYYLRQISGAELPIVSPDSKAAKRILIGQSPEIARLLGGIDFNTLKSDEIIIRTVGNTLILSGQRPRGTLYAVDTFLEDTLGVRWWTANESYVPSRKTVPLPELNVRYAPPFMMRDAYYCGVVFSPEYATFASRLKLNGDSEALTPELGGAIRVLGFCHTFDKLLPSAVYFKTHPEWYSLIDGKRKEKDTQICLTNPEARAELIKNAEEWLRKNPDQHVISIAQNDNSEYCRCPQCQALEEKEGNNTGAVIHFVNAVAAELEKKFPGTLVETLAYCYTLEPPKRVRVRHNVMIRFCLMGANFARPIDSDANRKYRETMIAWSKISSRMATWKYVTNYTNSLLPYPNLSCLGPDLRFFAAHHVKAVFEQGNPHSGGIDDLVQLRTWVEAKLLWNPQLDDRRLVEEFIEGYYGPAAPYLKQYVRLLEKEISKPDSFLGIDAIDTSGWLSLPSLLQTLKLMDQARASVKHDPILSARVRRTSLNIRFGLLTRIDATRWNNNPKSRELLQNIDLEGLMQQTFTEAKEFRTSEEGPLNALMGSLPKAVGHAGKITVPDFCRKLPPADWLVIPNELFTALCDTSWTFRVKDAAAADGTAVRQSTEYPTWSIQNSLGAAAAIQPNWKIYLSARCENAGFKDNAFSCGVYDNGTSQNLGGRMVSVADINGKNYHYIEVGTFKLTPSCILWTQPIRSGTARIYFDRMILVKVK